jgi:hypothetical protein
MNTKQGANAFGQTICVVQPFIFILSIQEKTCLIRFIPGYPDPVNLFVHFNKPD